MGRRRSEALALAVLVVALVAACAPFASKGTMPPPGPNGAEDPSAMPDFIAVAGRDTGIAGYARKEDVLTPADSPYPVYGEDLRTIVGHMVAGVGFVPLGTDPAAMPTFEVSAAPAESPGDSSGQVILYVRNDADSVTWVAVLVDGQRWNGTGFWGQNLGAGCYAMPSGSRLAVFDRDPKEAGATVTRQLYVRGSEPEPPSLWIVVGADGNLEQGTGVPAWWGDPQHC
jgi:hypothetical protein